jgi:Protein of unknown function (DUF2827)
MSELGGLKIGITVALQASGETMWSNGIKQNAVYLMEALRRVPGVQEVFLVNTTDAPLTSALPWDQAKWPTVNFVQVKDHLDIFIELGGQIGLDQTDYLKKRGARLISYCCGSEYVLSMEAAIFKRHSWGGDILINQRFDDIWLIPQIAELNRPYFEVFRRHEAQVVPFVWSPVFLEKESESYPNAGEYVPRVEGGKRISIMEPNINVVKFCLYPVLIAEMAFRENPQSIEFVHVVNADHLANESPEFVSMMVYLDLVKASKIAFIQRYATPQFLAEKTDVVISHQWGNPLNYFYLEVAWMGYPLIHNADLCSDIGYFYPGHDVKEGAAQLRRAIQTHDAGHLEYKSEQRRKIARFLPDCPQVTERYRDLLASLMTRPIR